MNIRVLRYPLKYGLGCMILVLALFVLKTTSYAQVVVTTNSGGVGGPDCTLRDAIKTADRELPYGGCYVPPTNPNVVSLQTGQTYWLTEVDNFSNYYWANGLPVVGNYVRIEGNGATIVRSTALDTPDFRLLHASGRLELADVTLRNGRAALRKEWILDFTSFAIGDTFSGTDMSPLLPINDPFYLGERVMRIFSSADFGTFDPVAGGPQLAVVNGFPFGLPKAVCPRPNGTGLACTGALNLTFGELFGEPASNIRFDVSGDDYPFVDVVISLDAALTQLAYASSEVDAMPNTPDRIRLSALNFNERRDGTGAPVEVLADTEIYALAIDSTVHPGGLLYDNFEFNVDYIDRRIWAGLDPCSQLGDGVTATPGYGIGGAVLVSHDPEYLPVSDPDWGPDSAQLSVENVTFDGSFAKCGGGAIGSRDDDGFNVTNSEFRNNLASTKVVSPSGRELTNNGGAIYRFFLRGVDGGGVINASRFFDNTALNGGAIGYAGYDGGRLQIIGSEFNNNSAAEHGGALFYLWRFPELLGVGRVVVDRSAFVGNQAGDSGGGAYLRPLGIVGLAHDDFEVRNSTFTGNQASLGGGIAVGLPEGTVDSNLSAVAMHNSTVSGNTAEVGGGIFIDSYLSDGARFKSYFSTVVDNSAVVGAGIAAEDSSQTTLSATLVANQSAGSDCSVAGTWVSSGSNMDSDNSCALTALDDLPSSSPLLGVLQDNGGPTDTHALLPGSPAIDVIPELPSGDPATGLCVSGASDQRGEPRPQGAGCDIGAYETSGDLNMPPIADAGGPYPATEGVSITVDGRDSMDPDGSIVSYDWDFGDGVTGNGVIPSHSYSAVGVFTVSLTVTDDAGDTDTDTTTVTVSAANIPPDANPSGPYVGTELIPVSFDGTASSDPDGIIVQYDWNFGDGGTGSGAIPDHTYAAPGTYSVTLTVTDNDGATDTATTEVVVSAMVVNSDPDCVGAFPSTDLIWPPNHKFVGIGVRGVTDADGDPVSISIDSIFQDEPVNTLGDGSTASDGRGISTATAEVRAERSGTKKVPGDGRVYHIGFTATDGRGGSCSGTVQVGVPHSVKDTPVDGGPLYDSTIP